MPTIRRLIRVRAPIERVFDLARSIDLHVASSDGTQERAVAGRTSGLIDLHEEVTWRARHLGRVRELTSRITSFDRPRHFRDSMVRGDFRRFDHDHEFEATPTGTDMRDVFDYEVPWGLLGDLANVLFLERHMTRFLDARNRFIRDVAESERWRDFLPAEDVS